MGRRRGLLGSLVVEPAHRGAGAGRRLVAAAEDWARRAGLAALRVRSRTTRDGADAFYRRLGFRRTKEQAVFEKEL